jgi:FtsP/CotA-like multicopper oxidase with cupredoxin domain
MVGRKTLTYVLSVVVMASILLGNFNSVVAQAPTPPPATPAPDAGNPPPGYHGRPTPAERQAAVERAKAARANFIGAQAVLTNVIDYFGTTPNYANSPQAQIDISVVIADTGAGTGAIINPIVNGVISITVSNPGAGYTIAPTVVITGGGGYGATAVANLNGTTVGTVIVTNPGFLYTSAPVISFVGGGAGVTTPAAASATVVAPGTVTGLEIVDGGTGYVAPTITFSGTQATSQAVATLGVADPGPLGEGIITTATVTSGGAGYFLLKDNAQKTVGIRKFVNKLSSLGCTTTNEIGQCIPVAVADTLTYSQTVVSGTVVGSDYYEIALVQYAEQLHSDLPPTLLRGYVQVETPRIVALGVSKHITLTNNISGTLVLVKDRNGNQVYGVDSPHYLGPVITATENKPTRIKFYNYLPTGSAGDLFIPTDTTYMGAGDGPMGQVTGISITVPGINYSSMPTVTISGGGGTGATAVALIRNNGTTGVVNEIRITNPGSGYTSRPTVQITGGGGSGAAAVARFAADASPYTQNRATLHLHGGNTPWISDGTPHQWTTPAGENTAYPEGVSVYNVPDMPDPGDGSLTFFYTNQQSARLMFYHDHAYGLTRLNVYAGEAGGYLVADATENALINGGTVAGSTFTAGTLPADQIPLVIQDKTFVDATQIAYQDPTWRWGMTPTVAHTGDLWFPHVYMPNQNPFDLAGVNAMGRWDYGPWFWPPYTGLQNGPVANPLYGTSPTEGPWNPGIPDVSGVPEGFMDTPLVNGTVYPVLKVDPKAYRFRILNAANDRYWNLSLFQAASNGPMWDGSGNLVDPGAGEVPMVAAVPGTGLPATWPTDGRDGGAPDPKAAGPSWLQYGSEGGIMPALSTIKPNPVTYNYNRRDIVVLNVADHALFLGPAERADVVVDFSAYAGKTLILYNDAPAPVPAFDPRYDNYTGNPDMSDSGGAHSTLPGYGPNTRTIMQIQVAGTTPATPFGKTTLATMLPKAFAASQPTVIVPQGPYNAAYNTTFPVNNSAYLRIQDTQLVFTPTGQTKAITMTLQPKAIQELFTVDYGRMNATLGVELPNSNATTQTTIPYGYVDPVTEILRTGDGVAAIGTAADGTQIWKITHNGVDTHAIHFHMFNVQVLNRVGWDGAVRYPEANEIGWKDTVKMNPLEDIFIATRPIIPTLPFVVGNSIRALDVTMPVGAAGTFFNVDPSSQPAAVLNPILNFGWEYVWHCHLLGHEENDMMRAMIIAVPPNVAPSNMSLQQLQAPQRVALRWSDTSMNATHYTIERATNAGFTQNLTTFVVARAPGIVQTYSDATIVGGATYYYRVRGSNVVGDTQVYASPAIGYPSMKVDTAGASNALPATIQVVPPYGLVVTQNAFNRISLAWTAGQTVNITGFQVQRATNAGFTAGLTSFNVLNPLATTYQDTTVVRGTLYYYRVRAIVVGAPTTYSQPSNSVNVRAR